MTEAQFIEGALANSVNAELLARLRSLDLPECHLTAGCPFQPIWNKRSGQPAGWGIKDYAVFDFDPDTSWDAEDQIIRQIAAATTDLSVVVEARNPARVHLWYPTRFGGLKRLDPHNG